MVIAPVLGAAVGAGVGVAVDTAVRLFAKYTLETVLPDGRNKNSLNPFAWVPAVFLVLTVLRSMTTLRCEVMFADAC